MPGLQQFGIRRGEKDEGTVEGDNRANDRRRKRGISSGHVVERAVRFDVLQAHVFGGRDARYGGDLIQDAVFGVSRREAQFAAPEAHKIGKAGMSADGNGARFCEPDRVAKHRRIAGVKAGRDFTEVIDHQPGVVTERVHAE